MHFVNSPSLVRTQIFSGLLGIFALGFSSPLFAQSPIPAGDLTVTVNELKNGDVKIALSGTAYMQSDSLLSFSETNIGGFASQGLQVMPKINVTPFLPFPPASGGYGEFPLPDGLKLTIPESLIFYRNSQDTLEQKVVSPRSTKDLAITTIVFQGFWYLTGFESLSPRLGDPIVGSGSVIANNFPFWHFVPGTFLVTPSDPQVFVTTAKAVGAPQSAKGVHPYYITYKVIPYSEGLSVEKPKRFRKTSLGRSSRPQHLTVTNLGSLPLNALEVLTSEKNEKNFKVSQLDGPTLEPGASTTFRAIFKPRRVGQSRADVTVTDGNVKQIITLKGKGKGIDSLTNSPRFPRGPGN